MRLLIFAASSLSFMAAVPAMAQFREGEAEGAKVGEERVQRLRIGVIVQAAGGACQGLTAYATVPTDWPEQQVQVVEEDVSSSAKISYQMVDGMAKAMVVRIASLPAGEEAKALVTFEVRRRTILPPDDASKYVLPDTKKLDRQTRLFLGDSPLIESRDRKIRDLAKQLGSDKEKAWEKVEAIYDWVREKVQYKNGPIKGALAALKDGTGDCEEMTSLFIAICRASGIPARSVWVEGHCYPEFYLVDEAGKGHWFPCQAAGSRAFGGIPELRPVLQKGDNIHPPYDRRKAQRYLADDLRGAGGRPRVKFVREKVSQ